MTKLELLNVSRPPIVLSMIPVLLTALGQFLQPGAAFKSQAQIGSTIVRLGAFKQTFMVGALPRSPAKPLRCQTTAATSRLRMSGCDRENSVFDAACTPESIFSRAVIEDSLVVLLL